MLIDKEIMYKGRKLTYDELKPHSMIKIKVLCDRCGKIFISNKNQLERNGHQFCQACALYLKQTKFLNPGDKYGRLTVIGPGSKPGYSLCECECGTIRDFYNISLKSGATSSCGCFQKEIAIKQCMKILKVESKDFYLRSINLNKERSKINSSKEYKTIREYNSLFRCIKCLSCENIETHHIISFSIDQSKYTDPSNVVPLCRKCHREYHKLYGIIGGEKEFSEFLNTLIDPLE